MLKLTAFSEHLSMDMHMIEANTPVLEIRMDLCIPQNKYITTHPKQFTFILKNIYFDFKEIGRKT